MARFQFAPELYARRVAVRGDQEATNRLYMIREGMILGATGQASRSRLATAAPVHRCRTATTRSCERSTG